MLGWEANPKGCPEYVSRVSVFPEQFTRWNVLGYVRRRVLYARR